MRPRRLATAIVLIALAGACQRREDIGPRHREPVDRVSFEIPKGFHLEHERDTWLLVGEKDLARATIAIRSVPIAGWSEERTPEMVIPATKKALAALPGARVTGPTEADHPDYHAVAFDLVFTPPNHHGHKYARHHVVLFSESRVFHVLLTAPPDLLEKARPQFDRILATVEEES